MERGTRKRVNSQCRQPDFIMERDWSFRLKKVKNIVQRPKLRNAIRQNDAPKMSFPL
jgi:hypothetical protein